MNTRRRPSGWRRQHDIEGGPVKILLILSGIIMLILGRKLFWLFIGIAGFLAGLEFAAFLLPDRPLWVLLLVGISLGLVGVVAAILVQRVGFALAGFYGGAYLLFMAAQSSGIGADSIIPPLAGGVIGGLVAILIMDWALILLSSLAGSGAIVTGLGLEHTIGAVLFVIVAAVGVAVQRLLMTPLKRG